MAEVFKAKSFGVEGFEKVLVIKRILPELARRAEFVEMFVHEAKLAVRLSHANIVQVFDLGLTGAGGEGARAPAGDAYFMAMEYVHGFDLATLLARCRREQVLLPIDLCVYIAAEVAKGLDHAHRRRDEQLRPLGIVHRDVSPQNVLLSLEGEVKVTDFGIAKARSTLHGAADETRTRQLHGKFGYMSPEQARGDAVDARSDLFSLGVILYECAAGVNPFSAPTAIETLRRVGACEYPPLELLRPDAPPEFVALVKTALEREPSRRYADAGRMVEAMLAFLYAQRSRASANDLAEFVLRFAQVYESGASLLSDRLLDGEPAPQTADRTPVESPRGRLSHPGGAPSETGARIMAVNRAAELGERREVTALVIELADRDAIETADRAASIVERYGGRIHQREPEHIAGIFGLAEPDGRDTEVATRCALVALRTLEGPRPLSAGIHAARIHVSTGGQATADERLSALVATARQFARARAGKVAISAAALRQVRGLFELEPLAERDARELTGLTGSVVKDVRHPADTFGRFVGRKDELRIVGQALATATKRSARVLTLRGDHGVGKTRILHEVERRLYKGGYNVGYYVATCPPHGRELPLSGIICMLHVLCGLSEGDPPPRVLAVEPRLRALGLHDEEVAAILNALGATVPAANRTARIALKHAFARMVASLCEDKPYGFAWDAAHGMDDDSFAVLGHVVEKLPSARLVLALAVRAGYGHPLERSERHEVIELKDLRADDAERLIAARLGVDQVPDELVRFVRDRAGGHPLFIEEVLKALVDASTVIVANRKVASMRLVGQELALPKTLRGLVASRVARLSPEERTCLQAAAVIGDPVDASVLATMLGEPMSTIEGWIAALAARDLVVHTGPSQLRFTSPMTPEVLVDALTLEASRQMHAAAGSAFEAIYGAKSAEQAPRIAAHFYASGDRDRAAGYFAKSGERRLEARQMEAASRDYARAIDLCDARRRSPEELAAWLEGLTQAVRLTRSCSEAHSTCDRVLARVDAGGDARLRVAVRVSSGLLLSALHSFERARAHFAQAEALAGADDALAKRVLLAYAELAVRQGDFHRSIAILERLHEIVAQGGDRLQEHKILLHHAQTYAGLGDLDAAARALSRAEEIARDDAAAACEREKVRSLVAYFGRDLPAAVAASERALELARALGVTYEVAINLHNLGDFLVRLDDFPRAYGAIRQSIEICDEAGFERLASHNRMFLAFLDGAAGAIDAEPLLRQGVDYAEANDFTWDAVNGRALLAQLLVRRGEVDKARDELERAKELAKKSGNRLVADECDAALRAMAS